MLVQELLPNGFTVFWSERTYRKRKDMMFLALKRNGASKNALKSSPTHKSVHFTVMYCSRKRKHTLLPGDSTAC